MHNAPRSNRLHIAIFGRRNAGKSSLINALTNQPVALVSPVPGTTTDPVFKSMEILPIGPVVLIDTAGLDDEGELGELRVRRSYQILKRTDLALLVLDAAEHVSPYEERILALCREKQVPVVGVLNKADLHPVTDSEKTAWQEKLGIETVAVSAITGRGIGDLKLAIIRSAPSSWDELSIIGDLLSPGDTALLVVPIDKAAPKGRLILPQVQTIRDILDHGALSLVVTERELPQALACLRERPKIVVTDSQAFLKAESDTPPDVPLTSFSILFARYKGDLATLVAGAQGIGRLRPGDRVLMAEACTHHRVEDDIGRVKLPRWLHQVVGGELDFDWVSGHGFPENLSAYQLVIHCGGCMINRREMLSRIACAQEAGVPIVNYGVCIAYLMGILPRALSPFPELQALFKSTLTWIAP
ncbi:MAG: [FeFe] hydrogenase H-cluster maturation GTPase HydF [Dethiobacter sp.]|nr:[FeFe] hydrogenase H-cluster maturation GTPase HydF [Dethiobacter sp.]